MDNFVRTRAASCRDLAVRRAELLRRPIGGAAFDHDSMLVDFQDDPSAPPLAYHLIYQDGKGHYSGRVVTLRTVRREVAEIRLGAFCHFRGMPRAFLASRVEEVTDLATGELAPDGLLYFSSHPLLPGAGELVGDLSCEALAVEACRDEIILLSFIAASDEVFNEDEYEEIVGHVMRRFPEADVSETEIRRRIRHFLPDEQAFETALQRLCAGVGDAKALLQSMRRVLAAAGDCGPEEIAFAEEIERRLRRAGRL